MSFNERDYMHLMKKLHKATKHVTTDLSVMAMINMVASDFRLSRMPKEEAEKTAHEMLQHALDECYRQNVQDAMPTNDEKLN